MMRAALTALAAACAAASATPKYKDPTLPVNDRVADLLSQMTLEEKVAQLLHPWPDGLSVQNITTIYGNT
jgi:beta-glucosidase